MKKLIFLIAVTIMAFTSAFAQDRQQTDQRTRYQQTRDQRMRAQNTRDRNNQSTYGDRNSRTSYRSNGSRYRSQKHYRRRTTTYHPEGNQ